MRRPSCWHTAHKTGHGKMIAVTVFPLLCPLLFSCGGWNYINGGQKDVFSFQKLGWKCSKFPIQTNGGLNIIPAVHVTMPASPLIISALDSSKERRVMD